MKAGWVRRSGEWIALDRVPEASSSAPRLSPSSSGATPTRARLVFAESRHAVGDTRGARVAILHARDHLRTRAARIGNHELRESFLRRVPENARTLELAAAWAPDAA